MLEQVGVLLDDPDIQLVGKVQTLWSDYGAIERIYSPARQQTFMVKSIRPPLQANHPRGWHSAAGHQRKLHSYAVERNFYRLFAQHQDAYCRVPQYEASLEQPQCQLLVLEDLDTSGFAGRYKILDRQSILPLLRWLAYFHAKYIQQPCAELWPIGTYWHLATRDDEFSAMPPSPLKDAAEVIDQQLNVARYQTLVHGDAKVANFCFSANPLSNVNSTEKHHNQDVAALDFQYVGAGVGMKDLVYLLGSCLDVDTLFSSAQLLVERYFAYLNTAVLHYGKDLDFACLESQWRDLYPLAWADFHRFLLGWCPDHGKINPYMQLQTDIALKQLQII